MDETAQQLLREVVYHGLKASDASVLAEQVLEREITIHGCLDEFCVDIDTTP